MQFSLIKKSKFIQKTQDINKLLNKEAHELLKKQAGGHAQMYSSSNMDLSTANQAQQSNSFAYYPQNLKKTFQMLLSINFKLQMGQVYPENIFSLK